jgi:hypothetical protein
LAMKNKRKIVHNMFTAWRNKGTFNWIMKHLIDDERNFNPYYKCKEVHCEICKSFPKIVNALKINGD